MVPTSEVAAARRPRREPDGVTRGDAAFARAFARCALPPAEFTHRGHVRAAWVYLRRRGPFARAALCFGRHLRRYARSLGAEGKYHETLTWAFLALINERLQGAPANEGFEAFLARCPEFADPKGLIGRYYDEAVIASELARCAFVLPRPAGPAGPVGTAPVVCAPVGRRPA